MKLLLSALVVTGLFSMDQDVIESINVCKSPNHTLMVTITSNKSEGGAIWINNWEDLIGDSEEVFVPIQNPNSFKTRKELNSWLSKLYGKTSCNPITYDETQIEVARQLEQRK